MSRYLVKDTKTNITHFHISADIEYYLENNPHIKLLKEM